MSIADYWPKDNKSDVELAEDLLEKEDFRHLSKKQARVRSKVDGKPVFQSIQVDEYQDEIIAYLESSEGEKYKIGELEPALFSKKLVFHWENPEPVEF